MLRMSDRKTVTPAQRQAIARLLIATLRERETIAIPSQPTIKTSVPRERFMLFAPPLVRAILDHRKTVTRRLIAPQPTSSHPAYPCPSGAPGDRIWVREQWGYRAQFFDRRAGNHGPYVYAADGPPLGAKYHPWKPSLHMPRKACRLLLNITEVRCERVTEISLREALAEGCPAERSQDPVGWFREVWDHYYAEGGLGWKSNPWVWVIAFNVPVPSPLGTPRGEG